VSIHPCPGGGGQGHGGQERDPESSEPGAGVVSARTGLLVVGRPDGRKATWPIRDCDLKRNGQAAVAERVDGKPNLWVCTVTSDGREEWPLLPPEVREQRTQEAPQPAVSSAQGSQDGRGIEMGRERTPRRAGFGERQPLFMGGAGDVPAAVQTAAERVERLQNLPAMCSGSAVPIARDPAEPNHTQVLTADHCVDGWANFVTVGGAPGVTIHHDPRGEGNDMAVLDVAKLMKPLPLRTTPVQPGEVTYTVGYPGRLGGLVPRVQTITPGRVLRYGPEYIETDAVTAPGTSGGAILDGQGRIVGLLVEGDDRSSGGPSAACIQQTLGMHEPAPPGQGPQQHDVTPRKAGMLDLGPTLAEGVNSVTHVGASSPEFSQAYWDVVEYMTPNVHETAYDFALRATQDGHYDSSKVAWQPHTYAHPEPPPPRPGGGRLAGPPGGATYELQPAGPAARGARGFGIGFGVGEMLGNVGDFFVMPFVGMWHQLGGGREVVEREPAIHEPAGYEQPTGHEHATGETRAFEQRPFGLGWDELPVEVIDEPTAAVRYPDLYQQMYADEHER
jgi:hypothetical protein